MIFRGGRGLISCGPFTGGIHLARTGSIDEQQVRHVAKLSRLTLSEEEIPLMAGHLGRILEHVASLSRLDVSAVEPMAHPTPMTNCLRADEPGQGLSAEAIAQVAPEMDGPFLKVPKVLGEGPGA